MILPRHPKVAMSNVTEIHQPIFRFTTTPHFSPKPFQPSPSHCDLEDAVKLLSCNLFSFHQHYFWFSRSLQSLFWHKLVRFNQLQTHSADRTLRLRYYDGLAIPAYVSSAQANIGSYSVATVL